MVEMIPSTKITAFKQQVHTETILDHHTPLYFYRDIQRQTIVT